MASSSSVPARPEDVVSAAPATPSSTFDVLSSGSSGTRTFLQPPQPATFRSPQVGSISGIGYPASGVVVSGNDARPVRSPSGQQWARMGTVEKLMHLAQWHPNDNCVPPSGQPFLGSPSSRPPSHIRPPSSSFALAPGASGSSNGGRDAAAVQSSSVVAGRGRYGPCPGGSGAGLGNAPNVRPLQITDAATAATGSSSEKTTPPATDGVVQRLPPVLAMPTTAGAKVAAAANGRVSRKRALDRESSKQGPSKKLRQQAPTKQRAEGDKDTVTANAGLVAESMDAQSNNIQIVPVPAQPQPRNSRKRKQNAVASPSSTRCLLVARRSSVVAAAREKNHTILTWLIDGGHLSDREKMNYVPVDGEGKFVSGTVTRAGVHCDCCETVMPLPVFEAHTAGRNGQRPWKNILFVSGGSLLQCMQQAWEKVMAALEEGKSSQQGKRKLHGNQEGVIEETASPTIRMKQRSGEMDPSDDSCGVCADGGDLLCCDSCPSTFHLNCLSMKKVPEGSWCCHYCRCMLCMENDGNGLSTCEQCTRKYHKSCRPSLSIGHNIGAYCSENCKKVSARLSDLIGIRNHIDDGFSWTILKIQKDLPISSENIPIVLECNLKLAVTLGVLNECFNPVKDRRTKIDMLHQAVYSLRSEFKRISYEGFYTITLEKDGEIISAALLRIHGTKVAEMPFAGTLPAYRKQGMMGRLVNAVEQVLASAQVEKLVIPAIASLVDTWKRSFSFKDVGPELHEEIKRLSLVVITGTTLLYKPVAAELSSSPAQQAVASAEPWWHKYTYQAPPLTDQERAFLEMDTVPFGCSFTDLVTGGKASLLQQQTEGRRLALVR